MTEAEKLRSLIHKAGLRVCPQCDGSCFDTTMVPCTVCNGDGTVALAVLNLWERDGADQSRDALSCTNGGGPSVPVGPDRNA